MRRIATSRERAEEIRALSSANDPYAEHLPALQQPDGGFSLNPFNGSTPTKRYMVSLPGYEHTIAPESNLSGQLHQHAQSLQDVLKSDPDAFQGAWNDPEDGTIYLDLSRQHDDLEKALDEARRNKQIAIFDLHTGKSIPVPGGRELHSYVRTAEYKDPYATPAHPGIAKVKDAWKAKSNSGPRATPRTPQQSMEESDHYASAPDASAHPEMQKSYQSLIGAIGQQYNHLRQQGITYTPAKFDSYGNISDVYPTSNHMRADLAKGNLNYLPTSATPLPEGHPMAQTINTVDGPMVANDVFRAVHDTLGHGFGASFGPMGEATAWANHRETLPPEAHPALYTETRGQNVWTNYGPHMRDQQGQLLPKEQQPGMSDRPFAEQRMVYAPRYAALDPWGFEETSFTPEEDADWQKQLKGIDLSDGPTRQQRQQDALYRLRQEGHSGSSFNEVARSAYLQHVNQAYLDAEHATKGWMLNPLGKRKKIDPQKLWWSNDAYARQHASQELMEHWNRHPRTSFPEFKESLISGTPPAPRNYDMSRFEQHTAAVPYGHEKAHALFGTNDLSKLFTGDGPTTTTPFPGALRSKSGPLFNPDLLKNALQNPPPLSEVDPRTLKATQPMLTRGGVNHYLTSNELFADKGNSGNRHPVVYNDGRQNILLSGHHRAAASLLQGKPLHAIYIDGTPTPTPKIDPNRAVNSSQQPITPIEKNTPVSVRPSESKPIGLITGDSSHKNQSVQVRDISTKPPTKNLTKSLAAQQVSSSEILAAPMTLDKTKLRFKVDSTDPDLTHINAYHNAKPVGRLSLFTTYDYTNDLPAGTIQDIHVHPNYRRRGVATQLVEYAKYLGHNVKHSPILTDDGAGFAGSTPLY